MEQSIPCGALNGYLYTHWLDELKKHLSERTGKDIRFVRHDIQLGIEVSENYAYYTFRLAAGEDEDHNNRYIVTVQMDFQKNRIKIISLLQPGDLSWQDKRYGVSTDQNLIPRLHNDKLREKEADRFLKLYCPEALEIPMPVPIREIMEEQMDLAIETRYDLPDNKLAFTTFENDIYTVLDEDGNEKVWYFDFGTVVVDSTFIMLYGLGAMNFTLAHEAYHWFAHRPYVEFHKLIGKQAGKSYNGSSMYSADDILEIQPNAMASWILMPKKPFIQKYNEFLAESADLHKVISALAKFFNVSYTAATYRLGMLGLDDYSAPAETDNVTEMDSYELYAQEEFRNMVDSGQIVYTDGHYVINDPKYVKIVWDAVPRADVNRAGGPYRLTDYALSHPEEAFIRFTIDHRRIAKDAEEGALYRSADKYLKAEVDEFRKRFPKDAKKIEEHTSRFTDIFEKAEGKHPTFCQLAQLLILYRYGPQEEFDKRAVSREWMPEREMPEIHDKYFAVNQYIVMLEQFRDAIWDSDEDLETTRIIDQLCNDAIEQERHKDEEIRNRFQDNITTRKYEVGGPNKKIAEKASSPVQLFIADTHQTRAVFNEIMKGKKNNPGSDKLMSLCIGMCLSPELSAELFASAGRVLTWDKTDFAYRYILTHMRGAYVYEVNTFLESLGLDMIGANTSTGKKNEQEG